MKDAVIVSTARSPIAVAFMGTLNNIKSPTLTAHAIRHAVERADDDISNFLSADAGALDRMANGGRGQGRRLDVVQGSVERNP